ncbi:MAG: Crp/Fnr family transcriptional regulator [Bacteroidota bacterium]
MQQVNPEMDEAALAYLLESCLSHTFPKKDEIITAGRKQKGIFFLTRGLVRGFYVDAKGDEISIRFINHQGWVTHYTALITQTPSQYTFQCLEECEVVELPFERILTGYAAFPSLEKLGRLIAESVLITQQARIESFQFLDGTQRYEQFVSIYPDLFNRVSLSHLSTYLGIKRQSLSRIRKKMSGH